VKTRFLIEHMPSEEPPCECLTTTAKKKKLQRKIERKSRLPTGWVHYDEIDMRRTLIFFNVSIAFRLSTESIQKCVFCFGWLRRTSHASLRFAESE